MYYWSLNLIFKLKLKSRNWKVQYGHQAAILKVTLVKSNRLLSIYTSTCNVLLKFALDIQSLTEVKSPETDKSNMAARRPFWKWPLWKSKDFGPWPQTTCTLNLKLKFQSKLKLLSRNHVTHRVRIPKNPIWLPGDHFESDHRENSPVTQTTPEPTLLSWGGWPRKKIPLTPGHTASPVLWR